MKKICTLGTAVLAIALSACAGAEDTKPKSLLPEPDAVNGKGFVLVELFTSEGCSSCPAADAFLNALVNEAREKKLPVYALAFHVDYWNKLMTKHGAWADPFSDQAYTLRQKMYAKIPSIAAKYGGRMVTPQLIFNGGEEAKREKDESAVAFFSGLLKRPRNIGLRIELNGAAQKIKYTLSALPQHAVLNVAVVERGLKSNVTAGENHGKVLPHENVVRSFASIKLAEASGEIPLTIPKEVNRANSSVIVFAQSTDAAQPLACSEIPLDKTPAETPVKDAGAKLEPVANPQLEKATCKDGCVLPEQAASNQPTKETDHKMP